MTNKFKWLINVSALIIIILLVFYYYLYSTKNQEVTKNLSSGETEFLELVSHKQNFPQIKQEWADLDNNSIYEEYYLKNGQLTITENEKKIWESPADWWIDSFFLADSNNDGMINLNLSLWRSGSFGTSKPFWIEENDMSVNNHFFVLTLNDGLIKQIWGSSRLTEPNCAFKIADVDNDEKNELVVIEGDYVQKPDCIGHFVAIWKWNGWGFSNEWRSKNGNFTNLDIDKIKQIDEKSYIINDAP